MCVICRDRFPKNELTRYVCPPPGGIRSLVIDDAGKTDGRGFYLCSREACRTRLPKFKGWVSKCKGV
ncbi:MAG: YlxR family protein [Desulfovibrionales bacterium]